MPSEANKESIRQVLIVAVSVCLVCAVFVAGAVVALRPVQAANKNLDTQTNILVAAGLYGEDTDVANVFDERIEVRLVDLRTGEFADPAEAAACKAAHAPVTETPPVEESGCALVPRAPEAGMCFVIGLILVAGARRRLGRS